MCVCVCACLCFVFKFLLIKALYSKFPFKNFVLVWMPCKTYCCLHFPPAAQYAEVLKERCKNCFNISHLVHT